MAKIAMVGVFTQKTTISLSVYVAAVAYFYHEDTQNTVLYLGEFKQTTELFHRFFNKTMACVTLNYFLISQKNVSFSIEHPTAANFCNGRT